MKSWWICWRNSLLATTSCIVWLSRRSCMVPPHLYLPSFSGTTSWITMDLSQEDEEAERLLKIWNPLSSFSTSTALGERLGEKTQGIVNEDPNAAYNLVSCLGGWIIPVKEKRRCYRSDLNPYFLLNYFRCQILTCHRQLHWGAPHIAGPVDRTSPGSCQLIRSLYVYSSSR